MNSIPKIPTVAIIDDDPVYRKVIAHLLKKTTLKSSSRLQAERKVSA